jgi:hypothetical protein
LATIPSRSDDPVQRLPFADDRIGDRNPALGPFADPHQRCFERQRPQIDAAGSQQVEGHVSRAAEQPLSLPTRAQPRSRMPGADWCAIATLFAEYAGAGRHVADSISKGLIGREIFFQPAASSAV